MLKKACQTRRTEETIEVSSAVQNVRGLGSCLESSADFFRFEKEKYEEWGKKSSLVGLVFDMLGMKDDLNGVSKVGNEREILIACWRFIPPSSSR